MLPHLQKERKVTTWLCKDNIYVYRKMKGFGFGTHTLFMTNYLEVVQTRETVTLAGEDIAGWAQ